jgi:hypothetical protein
MLEILAIPYSSTLVVNIDCLWLYAELFNDFEIGVGGDAK